MPDGRGTALRLKTSDLVRVPLIVGCGGVFTERAQRRDEQVPESSAEQTTHGAVQQEIHRTVDQNDDVPDVAQRSVHAVEDAWRLILCCSFGTLRLEQKIQRTVVVIKNSFG